jgi:hypothetical protein
MMIRIVSRHFVAAVVIVGRFVVSAAPILRYMIGWPHDKVVAYCRTKRWDWQVVYER